MSSQNEDKEEKIKVQGCLTLVCSSRVHVVRVSNRHLVVDMKSEDAPEVFACLEGMHYLHVTFLGSNDRNWSHHHLFKKIP